MSFLVAPEASAVGHVAKLHGWYNTGCYTESAPYVWGNESRLDPAIKADGVANWDLSIVKKFPITADGKVNFQFRAEFYNLFNRAQFSGPNGTFDANSEAAWVTGAEQPAQSRPVCSAPQLLVCFTVLPESPGPGWQHPGPGFFLREQSLKTRRQHSGISTPSRLLARRLQYLYT